MAGNQDGFWIKIFGDSSHFDQVLAKTQRRVDMYGKSIGILSNRINTQFIAVMQRATQELQKFAVEMAKVGAEFEQAIVTLGAIKGLDTSQLGQFTEEARRLGATTAFTATQVAEGMQELGRAGLSASQIMTATGQAVKFAGANNITMAHSAKLLASTMKQFNLPASRAGMILDNFTKVTQESLFDIESLTVAMRYGGSVASSMGISLEETTTVMSAFRDLGLEGSMVGTRFRQAMLSLATPTAKAKEQLKAYGLTVQDVDIQTNGLTNVLRKLGNAGLVTAKQLSPIVSKRAAGAIAKLASDLQGTFDMSQIEGEYAKWANANGKIKKSLDELTSNELKEFSTAMGASISKIDIMRHQIRASAGVTEQTYATMINSVSGQYKILISAIEELQIATFGAFNSQLKLFDLTTFKVSDDNVFYTFTDALREAKEIIDSFTMAVTTDSNTISAIFTSLRDTVVETFGSGYANIDEFTAHMVILIQKAIRFGGTIMSWIPFFQKLANIAFWIVIVQGLRMMGFHLMNFTSQLFLMPRAFVGIFSTIKNSWTDAMTVSGYATEEMENHLEGLKDEYAELLREEEKLIKTQKKLEKEEKALERQAEKLSLTTENQTRNSEELDTVYQQLNKEQQDLKKENKTLEKSFSQLDQEMEEIERDIVQVTRKTENYKKALEQAKQEQKKSEKTAKSYASGISKMDRDIDKATQSFHSHSASIEKLKQKQKTLDLSTKSGKAEFLKIKKSIDSHNLSVDQAVNKIEKLQAEKTQLTAKLNKEKQAIDQNSRKVKNLSNDYTNSKKRLKELNTELKANNATYTSNNAKIQANKKRLLSLNNQLRKNEKSFQNLKNEMLKGKITSTEYSSKMKQVKANLASVKAQIESTTRSQKKLNLSMQQQGMSADDIGGISSRRRRRGRKGRGRGGSMKSATAGVKGMASGLKDVADQIGGIIGFILIGVTSIFQVFDELMKAFGGWDWLADTSLVKSNFLWIGDIVNSFKSGKEEARALADEMARMKKIQKDFEIKASKEYAGGINLQQQKQRLDIIKMHMKANGVMDSQMLQHLNYFKQMNEETKNQLMMKGDLFEIEVMGQKVMLSQQAIVDIENKLLDKKILKTNDLTAQRDALIQKAYDEQKEQDATYSKRTAKVRSILGELERLNEKENKSKQDLIRINQLTGHLEMTLKKFKGMKLPVLDDLAKFATNFFGTGNGMTNLEDLGKNIQKVRKESESAFQEAKANKDLANAMTKKQEEIDDQNFAKKVQQNNALAQQKSKARQKAHDKTIELEKKLQEELWKVHYKRMNKELAYEFKKKVDNARKIFEEELALHKSNAKKRLSIEKRFEQALWLISKKYRSKFLLEEEKRQGEWEKRIEMRTMGELAKSSYEYAEKKMLSQEFYDKEKERLNAEEKEQEDSLRRTVRRGWRLNQALAKNKKYYDDLRKDTDKRSEEERTKILQMQYLIRKDIQMKQEKELLKLEERAFQKYDFPIRKLELEKDAYIKMLKANEVKNEIIIKSERALNKIIDDARQELLEKTIRRYGEYSNQVRIHNSNITKLRQDENRIQREMNEARTDYQKNILEKELKLVQKQISAYEENISQMQNAHEINKKYQEEEIKLTELAFQNKLEGHKVQTKELLELYDLRKKKEKLLEEGNVDDAEYMHGKLIKKLEFLYDKYGEDMSYHEINRLFNNFNNALDSNKEYQDARVKLAEEKDNEITQNWITAVEDTDKKLIETIGGKDKFGMFKEWYDKGINALTSFSSKGRKTMTETFEKFYIKTGIDANKWIGKIFGTLMKHSDKAIAFLAKAGSLALGWIALIPVVVIPIIKKVYKTFFNVGKKAFSLLVEWTKRFKDLMFRAFSYITNGLETNVFSVISGAIDELLSKEDELLDKQKELAEQVARREISQSDYEEAIGNGVGAIEPAELANEYVDNLVNNASRFVEKLATYTPLVLDAFAKQLPSLFSKIRQYIPTFASSLAKSLPRYLRSMLNGFISMIPTLGSSLRKVALSVVNFISIEMARSAPALFDILLNELKLIGTFITKQAPKLVYFLGHKGLPALLGFIGDAMAWVSKNIGKLVPSASKLISMFIKFTVQIFKSLSKSSSKIIPAVLPMLITAFLEATHAIFNVIGDLIAVMLYETMPELIKALWKEAPNIIYWITRLFFESSNMLIKMIPIILKVGFDLIFGTFLPMLVVRIIQYSPEIIGAFFKGMWDGAVSLITESANLFVQLIIEPIEEFFGRIGDFFKGGKGKNASVNIDDDRNILQKAGDWVKGMLSFGDTPHAIKAGTEGMTARFKAGDYVIAAQQPENLLGQALSAFMGGGNGGIMTAPPSGSSMTIDLSVIADGRLLDAIQVSAMNRGQAPRMTAKIRRASGVKVGFDRGRFNKY